MQRLNMGRMMANYEKRTGGLLSVVATLHDVQEITPELAKVIVSFSTESHDPEKNQRAIAHLFDGMAVPVEGSFRRIPTSRAFAAVGYVVKNVETKPVETAGLQKMRVMAGNLLMDTEDESLWQLKTNGDSKYLARHSQESLAELVQLAGLRHHNEFTHVGKISDMVISSVQRNEFCVYVNPRTAEVCAGYALVANDKGMEIFNVGTEKSEVVGYDLLIESAHLKLNEAIPEVAAPKPGSDKEAMKAYYRQLYSYAPDYLAEVLKQIDESAIA